MKSFTATGFDSDYHDISCTLSRRTKGCEQVAGVFKSFPTNNANIGEEDYAIVSLMRSEDIPFAGWVIETTPDRKAAKAQRTIREYMVLVGIACVIGIPIAVYAAQEYLKDFIYRLEGYWWIFVVAVLLTGLIAFVSVIWQVLKAAKTNPAIELKKE